MVDFHFCGVNLYVLWLDLRVYLFIYGIVAIYTLLFLIAKWYVVRIPNANWVLSSALFCGLNTVLDAQKHFKWDTFPKWHHCDPLGIEDRTHVWENHALPITLIMFVRVFAIIIINNVTNCYPIQGIYWCASQINYNNDKKMFSLIKGHSGVCRKVREFLPNIVGCKF